MIRHSAFPLILLFALLTSSSVRAQESLVLDDFLGVAQARQVQLRWVISAGQTCNGTYIERSADTIHWETIGDIPGVCGSSSAPVPYNFIDESPISNALNFYRLVLTGQGYSPVIRVPFYNYSEIGYVLIPNPARDVAALYFGTSETEAFSISIFDLSGKKCQEHSGTGGRYSLNVSTLPIGTYVFVLSRQGKKNINGKLVRQ
jgi:hypothetical protein